MARADHAGGSGSRDQGGAAGGTGRSLNGSPGLLPGPDPPGKPQSLAPPAPAPAPKQWAAQRVCFVCFLYVCLLPSPASSAHPPRMSPQSPPWREMNRSHRPGQRCVSKPFSQEKQVIVMRLPLHARPSGAK